MSKKWKFKITDPEALLKHCPDAVTKKETIEYKTNYTIIAKLLDAAALTGSEVPGIEVNGEYNV